MFKNIFGDKPWYQSLTAWGLIVFTATAGVEASLADQCASGALVGFACAKALPALHWAGGIMTMLGLRKATNT